MYGDEATGSSITSTRFTRRYLLLHRDGRCFRQTEAGLVEVDFEQELRRVRNPDTEGQVDMATSLEAPDRRKERESTEAPGPAVAARLRRRRSASLSASLAATRRRHSSNGR